MAQVNCNDGTNDVDNGDLMPCLNHGGVAPSVIEEKNRGGGIPEDHTNDNNPRKDCGGYNFSFHCWRKEAQVGFGLGSALMLGYGIYKKKSTMSIIGLTLLGGLGGIIASNDTKKRQ